MMIGMDGILRLIELSIWTTVLKGERNSVSLLLIAKPESGKSDALERFVNSPNVIHVNDMTSWGLTKEIFPKLDKSQCLQAILIPDFINVLSRAQATVATLMQTLKSLMEEGVEAIHTYSMDFRYSKPLRAAILTSITPSEFEAHRRAWTKSGILSRFIVLSYEYSASTQAKINNYLEEQVGMLRETNIILNLPRTPVQVYADGRLLRPMGAQVDRYRDKLRLMDEGYGFRTKLHFQRLVAAHALASGRTTVEKVDVESVATLLDLFANLDYQKV